ncbi:sialate O-acetylesterase [Termitidicoccus mucosus]|uniref:sialate O-acetylesterase n=1 Tax=Termitidicoccus mucosus TaxID=1184151 RepID=UPI002FEE3A7E
MCAFVCLLTAAALHADVRLAPLFQDHAVLQRGKPVPVWGLADPGEAVMVEFKGRSVSATADADGRWRVRLPAMEADAKGARLVVRGKNRLTLDDIVVGDVWLCSGQSNMEWTVENSTQAGEEIASATNPLIREFKIVRAVSEKPLFEGKGQWRPCSKKSVRKFTAVGYFFAREIYENLKVPVGLINSTWGGTRIEFWMSSEALASTKANAGIQARWINRLNSYPGAYKKWEIDNARWEQEQRLASRQGTAFTARRPLPPEGPGSRNMPSGLYNGMINPLVPYGLAGVLWWQGEHSTDRPDWYQELFPVMIKQWRAAFGQGDLPFYYVQLASYEAGNDKTRQQWAFLREAQMVGRNLPNTGMVVSLDIGKERDIHPPDKQVIGRRLACAALAKTYGKTMQWEGPRMERIGRNPRGIRIIFKNAEGLACLDEPVRGFEIAGADHVFREVPARIDGDSVLLDLPQGTVAEAVRYCWWNFTARPMHNAAGFPAEPFRTDKWPMPR